MKRVSLCMYSTREAPAFLLTNILILAGLGYLLGREAQPTKLIPGALRFHDVWSATGEFSLPACLHQAGTFPTLSLRKIKAC